MSSAFYPLGFQKYNNHVPQGGYKSWKGVGKFSLPVGITATHIRPLTNKDPGNCFSPGFGLPRPLRHYRRGTVPRVENYEELLKTSPEIAYNLNRAVKSSYGSSLGGKNGGLMSHLMDSPGGYVIKNNIVSSDALADCAECHGISLVDNTLPIPSLTETPEPNTESRELCCNEERKANVMVQPVKTMLSKKYYQTTYAKLYNRCKTFQQNQFNYKSGADPGVIAILKTNPLISSKLLSEIKPGSPLALTLRYQYSGQCNPNFVVEKSTLGTFLSDLSHELYSAGKITDEQLKMLLVIDNISVYISTLNSILTYDQYVEVVNIINTSASMILTDYGTDCKSVVYKPNNYKYAKQGAVTSGDRILKLNVETINKNLSQIQKGLNYKYNTCKKNCGSL